MEVNKSEGQRPTHLDRFYYKNYRQKRKVMGTLADRAYLICEPLYPQQELEHMEYAILNNGYTKRKESLQVYQLTTELITVHQQRC
ncbi:hypothetical protein Trydic_g22768 [Trypoxylus dichotomus]